MEFGKDKYMHMGVSAIVSGVIASIIMISTQNILLAFGISFIVTMLGGLFKEFWNMKRKNGTGFSKEDMIANAIGAIGGSFGGTLGWLL